MSLTEDTLCIIIPLCVNASSDWKMWLLAVCRRALWLCSNLCCQYYMYSRCQNQAREWSLLSSDHIHSIDLIIAAIVYLAFALLPLASYSNIALRTTPTRVASSLICWRILT